MRSRKSRLLSVDVGEGNIAYNPSVPFIVGDRKYMAIRMEPLGSPLSSKTVFAYEYDTDKWIVDSNMPSLPLQDPSVAFVNGEVVLCGVNVQNKEDGLTWKQDIYRGNSIKDLDYFCSGPMGMKDIRLVEMDDGVGVFTRPQGSEDRGGRIGYTQVRHLDEVASMKEQDWSSARKIGGLCSDDSWVGVNQATKLPGGKIGVIGHTARYYPKDPVRIYEAMAFMFNPETWTTSDVEVIARRKDFPSAPSLESPALDNVVFPAGVCFDTNTIYCGLSDYAIGAKKVPELFK